MKSLQFLNDSIISVSIDSIIRIQALSTEKKDSFTLNPFDFNSYRIQNDKIIFRECNSKNVKIWDFNNENKDIELRGHSSSALKLCIDSFSNLAISGSDELIVWDLKTRKILSKLNCRRKTCYCIDISADNLSALSGHNEGEILLWNLETSKLIINLRT